MNIQTSLRTLFAFSIFASPLAAQQMIDIPGAYWANDVTPDGQIVVGDADGGGSFIWRWRVDPTPTLIPGGAAVAVSDDGTTILGNVTNSGGGDQRAAIWKQSTGWVTIPDITECGSYTSAYGLSGDGTTAVGLAWKAGCDAVGFLWTASGGTVPLDSLANGVNRASAISRDGSRIGGFAQGSFDRTPATWMPNGIGMIYDINDVGEVHGLNNDGSLAVGEYNNLAFIDEGASLNILGKLHAPAGWKGIATDISEDAKTVVGFDVFGLSRDAWVWTESAGIVSVDDVALNLGISHSLNPLVCRAVSDDGNVIVGGHDGDGTPFTLGGFILERSTVLKSPASEVSLSAGGAQTLNINFRRVRAGDNYWVFGSATGTSPGLNLGGGLILPLNFDGYFNLTLTRPFAGIFGSLLGTLDMDGKATASLNIPAASDPTLAGVTLHHAATVSEVFGTIDGVSNAVSVVLGN